MKNLTVLILFKERMSVQVRQQSLRNMLLYIYLVYLTKLLSISGSAVLNVMLFTEYRIGQEVERSGRGLILVTFDICVGRLRKASKKCKHRRDPKLNSKLAGPE